MAYELARSLQNNFPCCCTGTFSRSMGLPCAHQLQQQATLDLPVTPDKVHRHWFFPCQCPHGLEHPQTVILLSNPLRITNTARVSDETEAPANTDPGLKTATETDEIVGTTEDPVATRSTRSHPNLLEPVTTPGQGRQRRTTRRNPSLFETVGARVRRRQAREGAA